MKEWFNILKENVSKLWQKLKAWCSKVWQDIKAWLRENKLLQMLLKNARDLLKTIRRRVRKNKWLRSLKKKWTMIVHPEEMAEEVEGVVEELTCEKLNFSATEAYNAVRTNLAFALHDKKKGKIVGFTSTIPQEGKSFTAVNLAYSLASNGNKVLLIGGDLRKPTLEKKLGLEHQKGLTNYLSGEVKIEDIIRHQIKHENLSVITSGDIPPNPTELLGSAGMAELCQGLAQEYDYILLDLPPVGVVIDAVSVKEFIDGLVVVIRHGFTQRKHVRKTIAQIEFSGIRILGFIYNCTEEKKKRYRKLGGKYYDHEYYDDYEYYEK